jgi:hypothetical protein
MIEAITAALNRGVASIARTGEYGARQSILRTAQAGERDVSTLERIALLQMSLQEHSGRLPPFAGVRTN